MAAVSEEAEISDEEPASNDSAEPDEDASLAELAEEDVPLADIPLTGDSFGLWALFALLSGAGLIWLSIDDKKRGANAK